MPDMFSRTEMLLGREAMDRLKKSKVLIFGLGGVGSSAALAIARCGVEKIVVVDSDTVNETNINRQVIAFHTTVGRYKTDVIREFILDINPNAVVTSHNIFVLPENVEGIIDEDVDYVIDAIDTVTAKLAIADVCIKRKNIRLISCMGTGNKLDPSAFKITDINKTKVCPLCRVMRKELKNRGIDKLKVLYSEEIPIKPKYESDMENAEYLERETVAEYGGKKRGIPGSVSFVPPAAGLMLAAEVIRALAQI